MCNEWDMVRIALGSLLLLLYAWISCPVPGADILQSLADVGCKFAFPIDYSSDKHWQLTSSPDTVDIYLKQLATRLSCREDAELLVCELREWHRALINSCCQDPRVYFPGDIVFACRAICSDASRKRIGKLPEYIFAGPWWIVESLHGSSYSIKLASIQNEKKRSTRRTYLHTRPNSSLLNLSMAPTLVMANYTVL